MTMTSLNNKLLSQILRIDHAGEYAAKRIYQGQLAVLKGSEAKVVEEMLQSELVHLDYFEKQIKLNRSRPSILLPLVNFLGYGLGVVTAKLGAKTAMAATIAVEEVISDHYQKQLNQIGSSNPDLSDSISRFKQEEEEHLHIAEKSDGTKASGYLLLKKFIGGGCKFAIKLVKYL